ncbi:hypothetical protein B0H34DRAFT_694094 [Crassisporium funariophilum]|nr:hypothetical protein B0H34DRAFT_694094 [Crassisporium funariophilum]
MAPRKRKRDQADLDEPIQHTNESDSTLNEKERAEKEQDVWEAVREAHYEAIEQLPLTLHRQFSLMRQLDEQYLGYTTRLLPTLQLYIERRQSMVPLPEIQAGAANQNDPVSAVGESDTRISEPVKLHGLVNNSGLGSSPVKPWKRLHDEEKHPSPRTPTPVGILAERLKPDTTRELLSHVAWLSDGLLRASQEKADLAQAAHDSVERHIHLLDQAIKEQEGSLSFASANEIPLHLSELAGLRRNQYSDVEAPNGDDTSQRWTRKKGKDGREAVEAEKDSMSLTITLPATQPSEELYCYCNRVSFGSMIACDQEYCDREWFHLGCVGLTEIPEGKWYCENCRAEDP